MKWPSWEITYLGVISRLWVFPLINCQKVIGDSFLVTSLSSSSERWRGKGIFPTSKMENGKVATTTYRFLVPCLPCWFKITGTAHCSPNLKASNELSHVVLYRDLYCSCKILWYIKMRLLEITDLRLGPLKSMVVVGASIKVDLRNRKLDRALYWPSFDSWNGIKWACFSI